VAKSKQKVKQLIVMFLTGSMFSSERCT